MPLNEITPVQTLLASRDHPLSLRPLDALQTRPAPYQALLCQPGGTLESSPRRIGNLDSTAAAPAYRALLGKATTSHADLVLTPEYSVPWSVFNDIIQGHPIPPEGALRALGFESITPVELRTLEAAMASAAQPTILLHEPLNHRQARQKTFIDPLVYLFWAREDNTGADVLCALVQFKTVGSRDPDHVERDHLYLSEIPSFCHVKYIRQNPFLNRRFALESLQGGALERFPDTVDHAEDRQRHLDRDGSRAWGLAGRLPPVMLRHGWQSPFLIASPVPPQDSRLWQKSAILARPDRSSFVHLTAMAMGKRPAARQASPMWVDTADLPTSDGHPFFTAVP